MRTVDRSNALGDWMTERGAHTIVINVTDGVDGYSWSASIVDDNHQPYPLHEVKTLATTAECTTCWEPLALLVMESPDEPRVGHVAHGAGPAR